MKQPEFPMEVKSGSCTVTIYETPTKGYPAYTLAYYQGGKRKRETSADFLALRTRADEVLQDLNEGRTDGEALRAAQRHDYTRSTAIIKPTGKTLEAVATIYAKCFEILGGDLVLPACQEYARRHLHKVKPKMVSEAVEDFIAEQERRQQAGKLSDVYVRKLSDRLRDFAESAVMPLGSVTATDLDRFLDSLRVSKDGPTVSPRTRDNWANDIVTLYEWAKVKRHVASDYDETSRITRLHRDEDGLIEIYTPEEISSLLAEAGKSKQDKELIPFLAIGAFAGLRSSEIMRLDWSDVKIDNGRSHIEVKKGKVKMRGKARRLAPMPDNLKAWLKTVKEKERQGPVWKWSEPQIYKLLQDLAPRAKVEWKSNALRHSFISYRVASIKDVNAVALESGNSPQIIFSNYRELVTEQDAQKWFAVMPKRK